MPSAGVDGRLGGVGPGGRLGGSAPWQHLSPRGGGGLGAGNIEGYEVARGSGQVLSGGTRGGASGSYAASGTPAMAPSADLFARPDRDRDGPSHGSGPPPLAPPSGGAAANAVDEMQVEDMDAVEEIPSFRSPSSSDQPSVFGSSATFSPSPIPLPPRARLAGGPLIDGTPIMGSTPRGISGAWTTPGPGEVTPIKGFIELPDVTEVGSSPDPLAQLEEELMAEDL